MDLVALLAMQYSRSRKCKELQFTGQLQRVSILTWFGQELRLILTRVRNGSAPCRRPVEWLPPMTRSDARAGMSLTPFSENASCWWATVLTCLLCPGLLCAPH